MHVSGEQEMHWANRYLNICRIGKGTFGTVYKVKDNTVPEGHGSIKVLKEIPVTNMEQDEMDECTREGKLLSKLSFPNIVQFFDSFYYGDLYCIITEFCEGGDLNQYIVSTKKRGARIEEKRIMRWFIQLIQALDYIHKRKILHRDLKTRNIFLKNDSIKIGDFGISRILNFTMDMASTFVGTPFYMSPEVLKHDGYNAVSDVWSAGVILFELCALKHAYDAQGIMAVMYKIVEGPCPSIPSHYSTDIQNILQRVMVKDPAKRPTASEVLQMEYIQKMTRDTCLDLNPTLDMDDTVIQTQTRDIKSYIQNNTVKVIKDLSAEDTLTPKQQMDLRKKRKADQEVEEKKKVVSKIYHENRESTLLSKQKSTIDSLSLGSKRLQNSVTLNSSYDENVRKMREQYDITRASESRTMLPIKPTKPFQRMSSGEHFDPRAWSKASPSNSPTEVVVIPVSELDKSFSMPNQNQCQMYYIGKESVKYEDSEPNNITTYSTSLDESQHIIEDIFYEDDFSISSNGSGSDDDIPVNDSEFSNDPVLTKFQDDEEKDPYGVRTKNKKITNMEKQCLEKMSKATLTKALQFLGDNKNRVDPTTTLRAICHSDDVALLVEQLHFLKTNNSQIY